MKGNLQYGLRMFETAVLEAEEDGHQTVKSGGMGYFEQCLTIADAKTLSFSAQNETARLFGASRVEQAADGAVTFFWTPASDRATYQAYLAWEHTMMRELIHTLGLSP